jgi:integrase
MFKRGSVWWVSFTVDGKPFQRSTGTANEKLAKKVEAKIKTQIVEDKWFDIDKAKRYTYEDMMTRFMEKYAPKKTTATQAMYKYARKHLDCYFAGMTLADITEDEIANYMMERIDEGAAPASANREFSTLSKAFMEAVKTWKWCKVNPCMMVSKLEEDNIQYIWLTSEQEEKVLDKANVYLNGDLPDMISLGIHTGMRREEILSLKRAQINLSARTVTALNTKNKEPRTIPMNDTVYEMLKKRLAGVTNINGYLFVTSTGTKYQGGNVLRAFKAAVREADKADANIGKFWFHGLRHTFGTRLAQAGKNTRQISELMGIKSEKVLRRYTHMDVAHLRSVVESLDAKKPKKDVEKT